MIPYDELPEDTDNHVRGPAVIVLSEKQIDQIAQRVEDRMLIRIGRRVVEKVLWAIGICAVAVALWLNAKGLK